ncbi:MAG: hypothetical protein ACW967_01895 [Candidatus Hodarchaeales archaeon]|jgi:hypothetical protein
MSVVKKQNRIVKERKIVILDPKRFKIDSNRSIIEYLKFFYHYRQIHNFIIENKQYKVLNKSKITIPGTISDHINALYKTSISQKTLNLIKEKRPSAILYVYSGYDSVISFENYNPTGIVELVFDRFLLIEA